MTILFASDLDRTLIYSKNSRGAEVQEKDLSPVEWVDEKPTAFMTTKEIEYFHKLSPTITFVPVTTRTASQYNRITGIFKPSEKPTYAIVSNGAVILENGKPLTEWSDKVKKQLQLDCTSIEHVMPQLEAYAKKEFVLRVLHAESWFVYMIIDEKMFSVEELENLSQIFYEQGFTLSHQGRKLYIMPNCINKSTALQFVKERIEAKTVIAAGDSMLDFDMVISADQGYIPSHGEAVKQKELLPPHVFVTNNIGVLAGEEIVKKVCEYLL
ncbi:HAD hydrolase family protein [Psychrobacillus sp. NEAU-3TGS]|uniref:HAD family hydrolase n=1 Tax=Psychrobacillus sp. NEAU-3TGS TaxID=2995412 RepID=UPI0024977B59|nr:HAD family hydrolase [Psychrobacillus sp. NEAU-3TGS]MDI2587170.1 HAD hydrolase family protein [Psychrobacillus sp. NEAU-3TGS]